MIQKKNHSIIAVVAGNNACPTAGEPWDRQDIHNGLGELESGKKPKAQDNGSPF